MNLYIKEITVGEFDTLEEFFATIFGERECGVIYSTFTYDDKISDYRLQCHSNSNRSFEDLCALAQTYFPGSTPKDVAKVMLNGRYRLFLCPDIGKPVFYTYESYTSYDKYQAFFRPEGGGLSIKEIYQLAGKNIHIYM